MKLQIDNQTIQAQAGLTLLDYVKMLGLDAEGLQNKPLAAKIAGEVFTLNYIPMRQKDSEADNEFSRRAMSASQGVIKLLRYTDSLGQEAYMRTARFVIFMAIYQLWPNADANIRCSLGGNEYICMEDAVDFDFDVLKKRIQEIINADIPLIRRRRTTKEAIEYYRSHGREEKAALLKWREMPYYDEYSYEDFSDYYCGEMMPSTGYVSVWDVYPAENGLIFAYPDVHDLSRPADLQEMPHYLRVFNEGEHWCKLMHCENISDLNELTASGKIRELIRVNEALHEKRFSQIADMVCERNAKLVMLAGPSSSGKTTSANRLATQLRVHGKKPILMSLDDYYFNRDTILPGPDGKVDLEHINTIDAKQFREDMQKLLAGESVLLPRFNFVTGKREMTETPFQLEQGAIIIVEGLHGLNPIMIPEGVDANLVFKLYVSPLLPLNLDNHNRIQTSYLRLLRRIVRDYANRGASVQKTLSMWGSVQNGEHFWIYPFQEKADIIFNSSTLYELAVLKKHIFPLLTAVGPEEECFEEVRGIVKYLNYIQEADVENEIPPTSIVREFVGGNTFYL